MSALTSKELSAHDKLRALVESIESRRVDSILRIGLDFAREILAEHAPETCEHLVRDWHSAVIDMETPNMDSKLAAQRRVVACETKLHSWAARSSQKASE